MARTDDVAAVGVVTLRVISFGAGVQTTALAILNARGDVENPARDLVFADTGGEKPETLEYLHEHFLPWAEAHGLAFHTVRAPATLYDYAMRRQMVPSIHTRWSTSEAKIRPIKRWMRAQGATAKDPVDVQVGISVDESHRAVDGWPVLYARKRWPLCEARITRAECHEIIASAGLPQPVKSGCWFCPFQSQNDWRRLAQQHPDLAASAIALEDNARARNPRDCLVGNRHRLADFIRGGTQLPMAFDAALENDESCTSGACFV